MKSIHTLFDRLNELERANGKKPTFWTTESKAQVQHMISKELKESKK